MITQGFTDQPIEYRKGNEQLYIAGTAAVAYDGTARTEFVLRSARPGSCKVVERIMPGAFQDVLASKPDVRVLRNHNACNLLGRTQAGTASVYTDGRGNLCYACTPGNTQIARDTIAQLQRGDLSGSSFAFTISQECFREEPGLGIVEILAVRNLFDVGPVTYPAYAATTAGVRSGAHLRVLARYEAWEREQAAKYKSYDKPQTTWAPFRASKTAPVTVKHASYRLRALAAAG